MNYNKKTIMDVDVAGKKILLRCDFNVPQDKATGEITSDKRIVAALPTIRYLLDKGAAVIACSHLGKPKGEWKEKLSLAPVAKRLSELLGREVIFAKDIVGEDAKAKAAALKGGEILLLENLRGQTPRTAKFVSVITCCFPNGDVITARGECPGTIAFAPMGEGGFGYDPVFFIPGLKKTFAQLSAQEKNAISHRGRALALFQQKLKDYLK